MVRGEVVDRAVAAIKRRVDYEYFFEQISSPDWIQPLWDRGFFREPPDVVPEGQYVSLPPWPESRYLARMAARAPELVARIILQMPDTANARVLQDLVEAAQAMPAPIARTLVAKAKEWAKSPYQLLLPDELAKLVIRLADGGEKSAALDLARILLDVRPDPRSEEESVLLPDAVARFEPWTYERIVKTHFGGLVQLTGMDALKLLSEILDSAMNILGRSRRRSGRFYDASTIWRPAIEPSDQNIERDIKNVLVSAVRDAADELSTRRASAVSEVVKLLESYKWNVFRRIALHTLREHPSSAKGLIADRLTDPSLVDDAGIFHEFWLLAKAQFGELPASRRTQLLQAIGKGPSPSRVRTILKGTDGRAREVGEARYIKLWQLRRLMLLGDGLPKAWRERREALARELGEPEHPEFLSYMGSIRTGPNSPKSQEDLAAMSVGDLIGYLASWRPSGGWMEPSPEGLGRELTGVVGVNPKPYATAALRFKAIAPTYVRALFQGWEEALRTPARFPWGPVLTLAAWTVSQPRDDPDIEPRDAEVDPGWSWARGAIAHLLTSGFEAKSNPIPPRLRGQVWEILSVLTEDPEPTADYEKKYGGSNMGPATVSLNTVRGQAMHGAIRYGIWVRRQLERRLKKAELDEGFKWIPELRDVLDAHLEVSRDASLAVRAVYGQWLPWLILIDRGWVERNLSALFPWAQHPTFALVAWDTYIAFNQAFDSSLEVLGSEYEAAIERVGHEREGRRELGDPDVKLAQHLMTFYWRGKLGLEHQGLVAKFFEGGSDVLRGHALDFIGRSLESTQGDVPKVILGRLKALWERELNSAVERGVDQSGEELGAFGWWFASGKFEDQWAIAQLTETLHLVRKTDPPHLVAQRLAAVAPAYPVEVVRALKLLIDVDDGIGILGWRDEARAALASVLASSDTAGRLAAVDLINILAARRFKEFEDLLTPEPQ